MRSMLTALSMDVLEIASAVGTFVVCAHLLTDVEVAVPLWLGCLLAAGPISSHVVWILAVGD